MTGLLLDTELNEEQLEFTETVRLSAESLLTIINDILDFSKIEAGKLHFEKLDFDLRNVVDTTIALLAERAQSKKIELTSLVANDVPTLVRGDAGRLRQVLLNLAGNAVKFTELGEVAISVSKESETKTHVMVRFEVRDTGIGISKEEQKRLFQAFVQADGSTTRKYGGTGLGLVISKQIVEMMGGNIGIESEPYKGSTFWFVLRLEKQPADAVTALTPAPRKDLQNLRVLIVDDNATNRKILVHQTTSWGMIPREAENGIIALDLLRVAAQNGESFDVALLDYNMPQMNGLELARAVKTDSRLSAVRLVLMPSSGNRGDGQAARETGISAYLTKPVRQSYLFDCLVTAMGESVSENLSATNSGTLITRHSLEENKSVAHTRVLIVEDNVVNQKVTKRQVEKLGYQADIAADGAEALKALDKISYDIVLMDCQMPVMDGYEATVEIRRREGESKHTTIIAMTANAMQGDREKCLAAGMDDYIGKPIRFAEFQEVLQRWVNSTETKRVSDVRAAENEDDIDLSVLETYRKLQDDDEPNLVADLVELYINDTRKRLTEIRVTLKEQDIQALQKEIHSLKGSSGNLGILRMAKICAALEENLKDDNWSKVEAQIFELESEFSRVQSVLENEVQVVNL